MEATTNITDAIKQAVSYYMKYPCILSIRKELRENNFRIVILVDETAEYLPQIPDTIAGYPVRVVKTSPIILH